MYPRANTPRWTAIAGLVFVVAWVIGLLIQPNSPGPVATPTQLSAYYLAHQGAQIAQSYLIDGIAGVALLVFSAALRTFFRDHVDATGEHRVLADVVFGAGVAAASVSLVQAALGETLANRDVLRDPAAVAIISGTLNNADTFKLLALAVLCASAAILILRTRSLPTLPAWLGWLGAVLAVLLVVGGLSFPLGSGALYVVLYVALPLLLIWVGAASVVLLMPVTAGRLPQRMSQVD
jgi:hypothetical protein